MAGNRTNSRYQSAKIAFCGLVTALGVVLMISGGLIPIMTYCSPMAAGVLLLFVMLEFGKQAAWTTFFATALISILLGTDKEAAFFYLFIGYYPLVKWELDRLKPRFLSLLAKLSLFSTSVILLYLTLGFVLNMEAILSEFADMGVMLSAVFLLLFNFSMVLYDRLMIPLIFLYVNRLQPKLQFLKR